MSKKNPKRESKRAKLPLASQEMRDEAVQEAHEWFYEQGGWRWSDSRSSAVGAVMEFIVNKQGFSLWDPL
jgi:hypothetical protein